MITINSKRFASTVYRVCPSGGLDMLSHVSGELYSKTHLKETPYRCSKSIQCDIYALDSDQLSHAIYRIGYVYKDEETVAQYIPEMYNRNADGIDYQGVKYSTHDVMMIPSRRDYLAMKGKTELKDEWGKSTIRIYGLVKGTFTLLTEIEDISCVKTSDTMYMSAGIEVERNGRILEVAIIPDKYNETEIWKVYNEGMCYYRVDGYRIDGDIDNISVSDAVSKYEKVYVYDGAVGLADMLKNHELSFTVMPNISDNSIAYAVISMSVVLWDSKSGSDIYGAVKSNPPLIISRNPVGLKKLHQNSIMRTLSTDWDDAMTVYAGNAQPFLAYCDEYYLIDTPSQLKVTNVMYNGSSASSGVSTSTGSAVTVNRSGYNIVKVNGSSTTYNVPVIINQRIACSLKSITLPNNANA